MEVLHILDGVAEAAPTSPPGGSSRTRTAGRPMQGATRNTTA